MALLFQLTSLDFSDTPFIDYLRKEKGIPANLIHYVVHCIAMAKGNTNTLEVCVPPPRGFVLSFNT